MNSLGTLKNNRSTPKSLPTNPFARALAETEQSLTDSPRENTANTNLFSDALSRTGSSFDFNNPSTSNDFSPYNDQSQSWEAEQKRLEEQRKKEALRKKLHDQVNPVNTTELFSSREKKIKEEINKLREELRFLVKDVAKFHDQVELTLMTEVVNPGQEGKYYIAFFQQLRNFIMLLRQKIKSAQTWATQLQNKSKKKKSGKANVGMMADGLSHEKTSTIQNMMHHERSTMYSGG